MGLFDTIHYTKQIATGRKLKDSEFQTKGLACAMDHYSLTEEGLLLSHEDWRDLSSQNAKIILYHGDLRLVGHDEDGGYLECVARFTHGKLEFLKPLEECSPEECISIDLRD